ncbi:Alkaline phosphatase synthesis transcriptional regulatory protein SphR [Geodia barretti]|uniref:Alkaline phosphatase synthesis transcriptional regulatory protein SphR n=1 Tax=Geodia barretti TaxID=519541 RepID=A0AA35RAP4_GEOBA|nr:Alkaline phosphatase synthesis transcriptional regulatory protein SphR [Geodia barretti]
MTPTSSNLSGLYLERDGYRVLTAGDGATGLSLARQERPDLVVLDLMLPLLNGLDVCRALREESAVPIIMLTARVEEEDRLGGLDLGADDYVTKPFSPRELAARVRAVLRRAARDNPADEPQMLTVGPVELDRQYRRVRVNGAELRLTPTEFRLLALLMRRPGRIFTRDEIIDRVLGDDYDGFDRTVDAHVSSLRRKLSAAPGGSSRLIRTVYGSGYRLDHPTGVPSTTG